MSCASTKRVRTDTLCQFAAGAVRVMTMATTIEEALRPLFVTCNVIGLGIYGRERPRPCLSALYSLTVWTAYGWLYCYIVISFKVESWFLTLSSVVKTKISILITVVTVINIIYYEKVHTHAKPILSAYIYHIQDILSRISNDIILLFYDYI